MKNTTTKNSTQRSESRFFYITTAKKALADYTTAVTSAKDKYINLMLALRNVAVIDETAHAKSTACKNALTDVFGVEWCENAKNKGHKSEYMRVLSYIFDLSEAKAKKVLQANTKASLLYVIRKGGNASQQKTFIEKVIKCDDNYAALLDSEDAESLALSDWQMIQKSLNKLLSVCNEAIAGLQEESQVVNK